MDDIVIKAMGKWPNVPACYGWLGLDARGDWYLRDLTVQAQGRFPQIKGEKIVHSKWIAFMGRNYAADANGCWFFQNGPQRVYVELESTPIIWRLQPDHAAVSHTGHAAPVRACLVDEEGRVYLATDMGLGLVHTLDVALAAQAVEAGHWTPQEVHAAELPGRYGYVMSPLGRSRCP